MKPTAASTSTDRPHTEEARRHDHVVEGVAMHDVSSLAGIERGESAEIKRPSLDFGHLALFTGQQINNLVRRQLAREGFSDVRDAHGYVFQHLIDGSKSISSLGEAMGISQQAASKRIAEMIELGYVDIDPASVGRSRLIAISARGWALIEAARAIRSRLQDQLVQTLDPADLATATRVLRQVLDELGGLSPALQRRVPEPE